MLPIKQKRYGELDALRGIAAILVMFFHFTLGRSEYNKFFKVGITGVDLFFIISGFVIFMSLQKISRGIDFVINRVSRLYPTYWASVSFTFILLTIYSLYIGTYYGKDIFIQFVGNLSMFQFYLRLTDLDGSYWTMIIEMIFYIAILILFQLKLLKYLNVIGIILCSTTVLLAHFFHNQRHVEIIIYWIPLLQFLPLFFSGTVFYKIYTDKSKQTQNYVIIIFCLLFQLDLFPYAGRYKYFISWSEYSSMLILYFILFSLFVNNKLLFIINSTTLFLGKISFALYLIHQCISCSFIIPLFNGTLGIIFWVVIFFIDIPIIIGIASFITYKIEATYSRKMKERLCAILIWQPIGRHAS